MIRKSTYSMHPYGIYRDKKAKEEKENKTPKPLYNDKFCPYKTILMNL